MGCRCIRLTDSGIAAIAKGLKSLRSLNCYACSWVTDSSLRDLGGSCPELEALDICGASKVRCNIEICCSLETSLHSPYLSYPADFGTHSNPHTHTHVRHFHSKLTIYTLTHTHTHTRTHTHMHTLAHTHTHTHSHAHTHAHTQRYTNTHTDTHARARSVFVF
jgi:hypothetical protein